MIDNANSQDPEDASKWHTPIIEGSAVDSLEAGETESNEDLLVEIVTRAEVDEFGYKRLKGVEVVEISDVFRSLGITTDRPTDDEVQHGIKHARSLVEAGEADAGLGEMKFMNSVDFKRLKQGASGQVISWDSNTRLYVDSSQILGTDGLENWADRTEVKGYGRADGSHVEGPIVEAIKDYAGRSTQLPALENCALKVVLTNEAPVLYVEYSATRTAAAKLRGGEPLAFSSFVLYDVRQPAQNNMKAAA